MTTSSMVLRFSILLIENLSRILTISSLRCPPLPSYLVSKICFCIIVGFSTTDLKVFVETRGVLWWWDEGRWRPWNLQTVSFGWGGGRWGRGVGLLHLNSPTLPSLTPAIHTFLGENPGGRNFGKKSQVLREKTKCAEGQFQNILVDLLYKIRCLTKLQ